MSVRWHSPRLLAGTIFLALTACASPAVVPSMSTADPSVAPSVAATEPAASVPPMPLPTETPPEYPTPDELLGTWEAEITPRVGAGFDPIATLRLKVGDYHLVRSPEISSGPTAVQGDQIEFGEGSTCFVTGTYRWSLTDGELAFTLVSDSCAARVAVLDGQVYRR